MVSWFLYARFGARTPFDPVWGGPRYVEGADLSDAGFWEVVVRTTIGGVLFAGFLWLCWVLFVRRLWERGVDPPSMQEVVPAPDEVIDGATGRGPEEAAPDPH